MVSMFQDNNASTEGHLFEYNTSNNANDDGELATGKKDVHRPRAFPLATQRGGGLRSEG